MTVHLKSHIKKIVSGLCLFVILSLPGVAASDVQVTNAWSIPLPPTSMNGAAYLTLINTGSGTDRLIGGVSDIAEKVEIHSHVMHDGQMMMVRLDGVEIPRGGQLDFTPGGLHIMLMGLTRPLVEGGTYQLTLELEKAGEISVEVSIVER